AVARSALAACCDQLAVRREHLESIVAAVHHDDVAVLLDGEARRAQQFAVAAAGRAPFALELAVLVEYRDGVGPLVRAEHLAVLAHRDPERPCGLAIALAMLEELGGQFL